MFTTNTAERTNDDIYDDFKLKKPICFLVYIETFQRFNPLNPHDALKHHFTSLKTGFIFLFFLQLGVLE